MQGKIIKGIAGFYYVHVESRGIYECKAKGVFRNKKIKPLVGDNVLIDIIDEDNKKGNISDILERKNELIRPASANIDQAMVIFAVKSPEPNYNLLDRFILMMDYQDVPTVVVFNKTDLVSEGDIEELKKIYEKCGCKVIFISTYDNKGITEVMDTLKDKTTILAGPSGVGKSSLTNLILPDRQEIEGEISKTGDVSRIGRGRHTTRHSELIRIEKDTYVLDTPGFSSLFIHMFEEDEIKDYFQEFAPYEDECRFQGCSHTHEPDCGVKKALEEGKISKIRYDNYVNIYTELKEKRKW